MEAITAKIETQAKWLADNLNDARREKEEKLGRPFEGEWAYAPVYNTIWRKNIDATLMALLTFDSRMTNKDAFSTYATLFVKTVKKHLMVKNYDAFRDNINSVTVSSKSQRNALMNACHVQGMTFGPLFI